MELEVRDREKRVNIWLTHAESPDAGFMESLKPIYREYKAKSIWWACLPPVRRI